MDDVYDIPVTEPKKYVTGFLVLVDEEGHWTATSHVHDAYDIGREANIYDIMNGCLVVQADIQVSRVAEFTTQMVLANFQAMVAQQMQQAAAAQESQRIASQLDLSKLRG